MYVHVVLDCLYTYSTDRSTNLKLLFRHQTASSCQTSTTIAQFLTIIRGYVAELIERLPRLLQPCDVGLVNGSQYITLAWVIHRGTLSLEKVLVDSLSGERSWELSGYRRWLG